MRRSEIGCSLGTSSMFSVLSKFVSTNAVCSIAIYDEDHVSKGRFDVHSLCKSRLIKFKASTWGSPVNSACQCLLIIMANTFLAYRSVLFWSLVDAYSTGFPNLRIYLLTGSRLKARLVFGLSFTAFLIGVPTTVLGWALGVRP
jgi:hypothetical protein